MSSLREKITEGSKRMRPGPVGCVEKLMASVPDDGERDEVLHVINNFSYPASVVVRELHNEGYSLNYDSLRRHRQSPGCKCPPELKVDPYADPV